MDYNPGFRHNVGIDCVSIEEGDDVCDGFEGQIIAEIEFAETVAKLDDDRQRLIAVCLMVGIQKKDIARMLKIDPSGISRSINKIRIRLQDVKNEQLRAKKRL